jgi:hypothetical protein
MTLSMLVELFRRGYPCVMGLADNKEPLIRRPAGKIDSDPRKPCEIRNCAEQLVVLAAKYFVFVRHDRLVAKHPLDFLM